MTVPRWWETSGSHRKSRLGYRGSWYWKGRTRGCLGYFQGGGAGGYYIWIRDVGDNLPHGSGPGGFPEQCGPLDHREAAMSAAVRKLVLHPPSEEAMREAGLEEVEAYVLRMQNMAVQYILT